MSRHWATSRRVPTLGDLIPAPTPEPWEQVEFDHASGEPSRPVGWIPTLSAPMEAALKTVFCRPSNREVLEAEDRCRTATRSQARTRRARHVAARLHIEALTAEAYADHLIKAACASLDRLTLLKAGAAQSKAADLRRIADAAQAESAA